MFPRSAKAACCFCAAELPSLYAAANHLRGQKHFLKVAAAKDTIAQITNFGDQGAIDFLTPLVTQHADVICRFIPPKHRNSADQLKAANALFFRSNFVPNSRQGGIYEVADEDDDDFQTLRLPLRPDLNYGSVPNSTPSHARRHDLEGSHWPSEREGYAPASSSSSTYSGYRAFPPPPSSFTDQRRYHGTDNWMRPPAPAHSTPPLQTRNLTSRDSSPTKAPAVGLRSPVKGRGEIDEGRVETREYNLRARALESVAARADGGIPLLLLLFSLSLSRPLSLSLPLPLPISLFLPRTLSHARTCPHA